MHNTKKITNDLFWIGANDRRLAMFEGIYSVPSGVSYNSYILLDDKTVLFDTVDAAVSCIFFENLEYALGGRNLDYIVIHHMEPDHSATLKDLILRYPNVKIICNAKITQMIKQFFNFDLTNRFVEVKEGDTFQTGHHTLNFVFAPMVHWPEVMVTYDSTDKILFSADAFGTFGAINGAIFADEVDFDRDYLDEARRYYTNIVGKYGPQVQNLLKKASNLDIALICPLHGFVWRKDIAYYIDKYNKWSLYCPEEQGVMIAYASIYGNTSNAAEIVSSKLRDKGIKTVMYDVSVTHSSDIVAASFKWSHLIFASPTYNNGIFIAMDELLRDIAAHNLQNRTVGLIENGSWAPVSAKLMKEILSTCKNINFIENTITIKSALKNEQESDIDAFVEEIAKDLIASENSASLEINPEALFKIQYGLFVATTNDGNKDNGCIINTVSQFTDTPKRLLVSLNKQTYTNQVIKEKGIFNISVLSDDLTFDTVKLFGFSSGRDTNKFDGFTDTQRSENGLLYLTKESNAFMSCKVIDYYDYDTHTVFVVELTEAIVLNDKPSVTYSYYLENIKQRQQTKPKAKAWECKICGYVYEGEELPEGYVCPICGHGADDFVPIN